MSWAPTHTLLTLTRGPFAVRSLTLDIHEAALALDEGVRIADPSDKN